MVDDRRPTGDPVAAVNGVALNDPTGGDATFVAAVAILAVGVAKVLGSAAAHGARSVASRLRRRSG